MCNTHSFYIPRILQIVVVVLLACAGITYAQENAHSDLVRGSLAEINDLRRFKLVVIRSPVIDVRDTEKSLIAEAYKEEIPSRRLYFPFATIARKLNEYIRKYRSMSAVERIADADYIILFNLLEYRRFLNGAYPYGELFVIVTERDDPPRPARIVWQARKVMWAEDAAKDLIKSLKSVRGER